MVSKLIGDHVSFLYNTTIDGVTVYSCDPSFEQENFIGSFSQQDESLLSEDNFDEFDDDFDEIETIDSNNEKHVDIPMDKPIDKSTDKLRKMSLF